MLSDIHKLHFIGIGGAGMSALARILLDEGRQVSGSDLASSPLTEQLRAHGAKIMIGHRAENIDGTEAIVVSSAIPENNPEVVAAKALGIPRFHRSDVNAALVNAAQGIAVAGAHGKTTTTSMIGLVLEHGDLDPTIIIGGEVDYLSGNARLGKGPYLVSEADESDGSFLKLKPHIAVVTNVEDDHLDHYGSRENIRLAFRQFIENVDPKTGRAVLCFDNDAVRAIAAETACPVVSYAVEHEADYQAVHVTPSGIGTEFDVAHGGQILGHVTLGIPGRHNVSDALAAIVTGLLCGLTVKEAAKGLAQFHGAKRRFETKARVKDVWIVDDYAHHPTEIATTLAAARQTKPRRLVCAFQPHRYSRTKLLAKAFGMAFREADVLILTGIYAAGEAPIPGIDGTTILAAVTEGTGQPVTYIEARENVAPYLETVVHPGDLVLTMGAGDIWRTGEELARRLQEK